MPVRANTGAAGRHLQACRIWGVFRGQAWRGDECVCRGAGGRNRTARIDFVWLRHTPTKKPPRWAALLGQQWCWAYKARSLRGIKLMDLLQMDVTSVSTLLPRITTPTLTPHDVTKLDPADIVSISTELLSFFLNKATRESLPA